MTPSPVLAVVVGLVALLLVAAATAVGLKRASVPYTVGLVLVGLVLGQAARQAPPLEPLRAIALSPELILFVFLPTLIFESAFNLDSRLLLRNLTPVVTLAAPGLLVSTAVAGVLVAWWTPLPLGAALLFGALISATDPVAVIALFKEVGAPRRLTILVEGESLFNDATAIVLFRIVFAALAAGSVAAGTIARGLLDFVIVFAGGLVVGAAIGWVMLRSIGLVRDEPLVQVTLSTVVAYAAFVAADHGLHVSGVMATLGAGIVVGGYGSTRFTPGVREYLARFWEYAAFAANSLIFLLTGLAADLGHLAAYAGPIGLAIMAVLLARAATVAGLVPLLGRLPGTDPIDWRYQSVLFWGGLRGAVALALALSLPADFAHRDLIVALTLGVALFTLLSGGLTMQWLMRMLGLDRPTLVEQVARVQADLAAKREALARVEEMTNAGHFSARLTDALAAEYREAVRRAESGLATLRAEPGFRDGGMRQVLWAEALTVERRAYRALFARGAISGPVLRELELEVDLERDALRHGVVPGPLPARTPFEVRLEGWMVGLVERVAPRSGFVQRHRVRALAARYEREAAVLEASRLVAPAVGALAELSGAQTEVAAECRSVYEARVTGALECLDAIAEHFPEYVQAVQQQTAQRIALEGEAEAVERLVSAGAIPEAVADAARHRVEAVQRALARQPIAALAPRPEELLLRVPLFQGLTPLDFRHVAARLVPRTVLAGRTIIRQGKSGTSLFLIARGVVAVLVAVDGEPSRRVATLHAGDFFGEIALLTAERRSATVQAVTDCQLYELSRRDVEAAAATMPGVKEALERASRERRGRR